MKNSKQDSNSMKRYEIKSIVFQPGKKASTYAPRFIVTDGLNEYKMYIQRQVSYFILTYRKFLQLFDIEAEWKYSKRLFDPSLW